MMDREALVLRSRIRLARNFKSIPFPHRLDVDKARELVKMVEDAFYTSSVMEKDYHTEKMWELGRTELLVAFEKHLVSPKLINNSEKAAYIIDKDENVSLMIHKIKKVIL